MTPRDTSESAVRGAAQQIDERGLVELQEVGDDRLDHSEAAEMHAVLDRTERLLQVRDGCWRSGCVCEARGASNSPPEPAATSVSSVLPSFSNITLLQSTTNLERMISMNNCMLISVSSLPKF